VHGLHSASLWEARQSPTAEVLTGTLGFRRVAEHGNVVRYAAGDGGPGTLVDVRAVGGFLDGWGGGGTVHHVAFRTPDDAAQLELRERVEAEGLAPTPVIDRNYFHSVYFRERGGVLFEIATDPPGMTIDEPLDRLGTSLMLPAQYEPFRAAIERELAPLGPPRVGSPLGASAPAG
jgi:glyoxalase family protein